MFDKAQRIFTYTLTGGIFVIKEADGVTAVAMRLVSGAGTYKGTKTIGSIDSTPTSLAVDKAVTITSEETKYLDEFTIDATAGVVEIIAR